MARESPTNYFKAVENEGSRCESQRKSCIFHGAQSNMHLGSATVRRFPDEEQPCTARFSLPISLYNFGEQNSTQEADSSASSRFGEFNMAWYAYCLTEHQTLPNGTRTRRPFLLEGVQGVNGAAVLSYPSGEFAVIVSEYDHAAGGLDQKSAIEHARVVSNCFRNSTVLPFKFGTIFESDDALRQAVRVNRRAFGLS